MMDEKAIMNKHRELCAYYSDKQIDDFDTFINSRLIEYMYNMCREDIDYIVDTVKRTIANTEIIDGNEGDQ